MICPQLSPARLRSGWLPGGRWLCPWFGSRAGRSLRAAVASPGRVKFPLGRRRLWRAAAPCPRERCCRWAAVLARLCWCRCRLSQTLCGSRRQNAKMPKCQNAERFCASPAGSRDPAAPQGVLAVDRWVARGWRAGGVWVGRR